MAEPLVDGTDKVDDSQHWNLVICPHLGLEADPHTSMMFASDDHRCYLEGRGEEIPEARQLAHCIGGSYRECFRLRGDGAPDPPAPKRGISNLFWAVIITVVLAVIAVIISIVSSGGHL